ncbi:hypothetical protein [Saccharothrix variisporea]|uniref:IPT/TIG domain-containing protein n=1 Tax=Saccharothrix variisporea TaxID=543527 RepID=A0A495XGD9_9PSEU|nr:hypothetical protein [Saccharothrix variisporea]RKT72769.1 hypothetical protein DFJ66_6093 [Saccharothrix variisporea]
MRGRRRRSGWVVLIFSGVLLGSGCAAEDDVLPPLVQGSSSAVVASAHLAAQPLSGKAGGEVRLSGEGYPANARVVFTFHGQRVGDTTTDAAGRFADIAVRVPESFRDSTPGAQFLIGATAGPVYAETPFVLTR